MEERTAAKPRSVAHRGTRRFRAAAVIVFAVIVGLVIWLALRNNGGSSPSSLSSNATAASAEDIKNLAASVNHPIFWVGPRQDNTYELTRLANGSIYVRYLPSGVDVGSSDPYLTVVTYPFGGAYAALKKIHDKDSVPLTISNHGIAVYSKKNPQSVHAAFPGVDYQVEVYDPNPGTATGLVVSGQLAAFGNLNATSSTKTEPKPAAASVADLTSLARSVGHPVYWVGPKKRYTYEVTHTTSGRIFIRYLPPGVKVGSSTPYLSVGTYPFPSAFGATKALAKEKDMEQIKLPGAGIAVLSKSYPQSVHLAYRGSDYQIEVYDPSAARVHALVASGQVRAIG
jgi:hypothetical protein